MNIMQSMNIKRYPILIFVLLVAVWHAEGQISSNRADSVMAAAGVDVPVPASLETLFSAETSYLGRCAFVKNLTDALSDREVQALLRFVTSQPGDLGLTQDQFNSLGDKVINLIERQERLPPELPDVLIAMYQDVSQDRVWRDYCLQHLGAVYGREAVAGKREQIQQLFESALETRMAGTVILALRRNVGANGISRSYAASLAARVAKDEEQSDVSRLTAIQVAAELGDRTMLPLAREIVLSGHSVPFRISAMASIGILGDQSDLPLLNKFTRSSDMRLRLASRAAIKKINARQGK